MFFQIMKLKDGTSWIETFPQTVPLDVAEETIPRHKIHFHIASREMERFSSADISLLREE